MHCQHLNALTPENLIPKANYPLFRCEECMNIKGQWVHLRICHERSPLADDSAQVYTLLQ